MLPVGNLNNLYYPMTADIYYASSTQNAFGEYAKSWTKDRTINCSAIKENPASSMRTALTAEKFLEYDVKINMRTNENIFKAIDGTHYKPTDILITNIKDPFNSIAWMENDVNPTSFEVDIVEPMFDEFHGVAGYRVLLRRSDLQVDV
jgi:hypothetical protein